MIELLAPAGNAESLTAALRCGADAVYIGGKNFSARQNASNFDIDEIKEAVKLCHRYGAKLHIAVNTMLMDSQLGDFISEIKKYAALSPDAFIVQDLGAAKIIKNIAPDIPLHASTQMTVHTPDGAKFAKLLGFSRVVVSREATEKMISEISQTGIETEIFVHGALCMSVSGQCYMSAMIGSRSANRGLCAQSCRLPFSASGISDEHCLSLKDLSLTEHIEKIKALGVSSLKIEGRMKRPEYVAAAVTAYRNALDGNVPDTETLRAVFSRSGFTDGYFTGKRTDMFGMREKDDVLSSAAVIPKLKQLYRKERKISELNFDISIKNDLPVILKASDSDGFECTVSGQIPETAQNRPTTEDAAAKQLTKLGDTIYSVGRTNISISEGLAVPVSMLNQMRREAVEKLYTLREKTEKPHINENFSILQNFAETSFKKPKLRIRTENLECLSESDISKAEYLIFPIPFILKNREKLMPLREKIIIEPPRFIFDENNINSKLKKLHDDGFTRLMCNNIAFLHSGKVLGYKLHGDFGLNIANSQAAEIISGYGIEDAVISFELKLSQIKKLQTSLKKGIIAYGKFPLMLTVNCPVKNSVGCAECSHSVTDRTKRKFFVRCSEGYTEIFNSEAVYLADKKDELDGLDFITLYFTDETPKQAKKIINDYTSEHPDTPSGITRGLYFRGVK